MSFETKVEQALLTGASQQVQRKIEEKLQRRRYQMVENADGCLLKPSQTGISSQAETTGTKRTTCRVELAFILIMRRALMLTLSSVCLTVPTSQTGTNGTSLTIKRWL